MKSKYLRAVSSLCAAVMLIAALSVSAFAAKSVADQMAANSAAWHVAYAAGDTKTCEALHAANVSLANSASSGGGSSSFNSSSGTWNISTSSGSTISSSGSSNGKQNTSTYTTTTSSGRTSSTSVNSYSDDGIAAYKASGGTNSGLQTAYNNAANNVSSNGAYGDSLATGTAAAEVAVAKALLGLTNSQATKLQADLEASKQDYLAATAEYNAAIASGNTAAAEAAKAKQEAAHDAAQAVRAEYNYTGDDTGYTDGGYYYGSSKTPSSGNGGGFFITDITATYKITASCNDGGTISPAGTVTVKKGESKTFTITPYEDYMISSVLVDGSSVGAVSSYTFSNVTSAHTILAVFKEKGKISIRDAQYTDALGADLSGDSIKSGYGIYAHVSGSHSGVTNAKMVMTYNFGSGNKTVTLQETSTGTFEFPKNSSSPTRQRCVYIPVATKDGTYTLTLTFTATRADGTTATETKVSTITVLGSMYEDDFTGDS